MRKRRAARRLRPARRVTGPTDLSGAEVAVLRDLCGSPLSDAPARANDPAMRRARRDALDRWSETLLDRPLRTARRGNW